MRDTIIVSLTDLQTRGDDDPDDVRAAVPSRADLLHQPSVGGEHLVVLAHVVQMLEVHLKEEKEN